MVLLFFFKDEALILESIFYYIVKMIHLRDLGSNLLFFFFVYTHGLPSDTYKLNPVFSR